jgi:hypothetical protein
MIPQPTVISTRQQAQELQQKKTEQMLNAAQGFANTNLALKQIAMEDKKLQEEKRQYDITQELNFYTSEIEQVGGVQNFILGTRSKDGNYFIENPLARKMFRTLYGNDGDAIFDMTRRNIQQTPKQIIEDSLMQQVRNIIQTGSNELPVSGGQSPLQKSEGQNASYNVPKNQTQQSQPQTQQQQSQGQVGGGMAQVETPVTGTQSQPGLSLGGLAPDVMGTVPVSLGGDLSINVPRSMASPENRNQVTPQYKTHPKLGLPIGDSPEQAKAVFPLNSATFKDMDNVRTSLAQRQEGESDNAFNKRAATALAGWGFQKAGQPGKELLAQATRGLEVGTKEFALYDAKAKALFGIDGKGLMALRGTFFHNIEKGKPIGTLPTEEEARGQWWWNGNLPYDIPNITKITDDIMKTETPNYNQANVTVAMKGLADNPKATALVIKEKAEALFSLNNKFALTSARASLNRPDINDTRKAIIKSVINNEGMGKREQAVFVNDMHSAKVAALKAGRLIDANPKKSFDEANRKIISGEPLQIKDTMAIGREQLKTIAGELQAYASGEDNVSAAVIAFAPKTISEQRTFAEAKRQFGESLKSEADRLSLSKEEFALKRKESEENIKIAEANRKLSEQKYQIELGYFGLALAEQQIKERAMTIQEGAVKEGGVDPKTAIDIAKIDYNAVMDVIIKGANGDPEKFKKLHAEALQNNPFFKNAQDTLSKLAAGMKVDGLLKELYADIPGENRWLRKDIPDTSVPYLTPSVGGGYSGGVQPNVSVGGQGPQQNPYNNQAGTLTNTYGGR